MRWLPPAWYRRLPRDDAQSLLRDGADGEGSPPAAPAGVPGRRLKIASRAGIVFAVVAALAVLAGAGQRSAAAPHRGGGSAAGSAAGSVGLAVLPQDLPFEPAFDCGVGFENWRQGWNPAKKSYCCNHFGKGCEHPFDCNAGFSNWATAWSPGQKAWCCAHESRGCGMDPVSSAHKYDCNAGFDHWQEGWSPFKKEWCCTKVHRGCQQAATMPYDCKAGFEHWTTGWTTPKKQFCCQFEGKACDPAVATTSPPFDCQAGFANWQQGWAPQKKGWCCQHAGRGCPPTTKLPFDCNAGFDHWRLGWSPAKKEWCCHHGGRACEAPVQQMPAPPPPPPPPPAPPTTKAPYDCAAGFPQWREGWSQPKKGWCCQAVGKGCDFDCNDHYDTWPSAWSRPKKEWCCQNAGRGCEQCKPRPLPPTPVPPGAKKTCSLWGDPHLETFDRSLVTFLQEGVYWLVKSARVSIQAQYYATQFTHGLAATHDVIVSGGFIGNHRIKVGPTQGGRIDFDGNPILWGFGEFSLPGGMGKIVHNAEGVPIDHDMSHLPRNVVHMWLPMDVYVQVMRWSNHVNLKITMPPVPGGQDGHCGNLNGNPDDDTEGQISQRLPGPVPHYDSLFHHPLQVHPLPKEMRIEDCAPGRLEEAQSLCLKSQPGIVGAFLDTCVFDVCFGGDQYAEQDGMGEVEATGYDCDAGYTKWRTGWSHTKREWCCKYCGRGCEPSTTPHIGISFFTGTFTFTYTSTVTTSTTTETTTVTTSTFTTTTYTTTTYTTTTVTSTTRTSSTSTFSTTTTSTSTATTSTTSTSTATTSTTSTSTTTIFICDSEPVWSWSYHKQEWCCLHRQIGCPTTTTAAYSCTGSPLTWHPSKQAWCCLAEQVGCETTTMAPFDCDLGFVNWKCGWPESKKDWCCNHRGTACAKPPAYDCNEDALLWTTKWTSGKKAWCCLKHSIGCDWETTTTPIPGYDCAADLQNARAWEQHKKDWCCDNEDQACYDCSAGVSTMDTGWSTAKKDWCCRHHDLACVDTLRSKECTLEEVPFGVSWQAKKAWCCRQKNELCFATLPPPYDCDKDFDHQPPKWPYVWPEGKKAWCCLHKNRGCEADDPTATSCIRDSIVSSEPFDCNVGFSRWWIAWSDLKREQCCRTHHRGCPGTEPLPTTMTTTTRGQLLQMLQHVPRDPPAGGQQPAQVQAASFDCDGALSAWASDWSEEKKSWCCEHHSKGCVAQSEVFDCNGGLSNWASGWSEEKKSWCCQYHSKGCPGTEPKPFFGLWR